MHLKNVSNQCDQSYQDCSFSFDLYCCHHTGCDRDARRSTNVVRVGILAKWPTYCWENHSITAIPESELTSVSGPLSAPGQEKVTNSWHRLWTTKQHTEGGRREREDSLTTTTYDTELPPCSCAHIKWIQSPNQPLKRKYWNGLRSSLLFYMLPDKRLNGAARNQKEKRRTSECACKLSSVNLQVILTGLSRVDTQTTSRQTARARARLRTCPHKTPRVIHSAAISSLQSVGLIASSPPPLPCWSGIRPPFPECHSVADVTPRQ